MKVLKFRQFHPEMLLIELQWVWNLTQCTRIKAIDLTQTVPKGFLQIFGTSAVCLIHVGIALSEYLPI